MMTAAELKGRKLCTGSIAWSPTYKKGDVNTRVLENANNTYSDYIEMRDN